MWVDQDSVFYIVPEVCFGLTVAEAGLELVAVLLNAVNIVMYHHQRWLKSSLILFSPHPWCFYLFNRKGGGAEGSLLNETYK